MLDSPVYMFLTNMARERLTLPQSPISAAICLKETNLAFVNLIRQYTFYFDLTLQ